MISTVGLRVTWFCAKCLSRAQTHQIALAGTVTPELPQAWTVAEGLTLCGACSDTFAASAPTVAREPWEEKLHDAFDSAEFRAA